VENAYSHSKIWGFRVFDLLFGCIINDVSISHILLKTHVIWCIDCFDRSTQFCSSHPFPIPEHPILHNAIQSARHPKVAFPAKASAPPSYTWCVGPNRVIFPDGIAIRDRFSHFAGLAFCDRQTSLLRLYRSRPHLAGPVMRPTSMLRNQQWLTDVEVACSSS